MKDVDWRKLFLEMLMVMIGVFLALLVDEWREERQISVLVAILEDRIIEEVHDNHDRLIDYEQRIAEIIIHDSCVTNIENYDERHLQKALIINGLNHPEIIVIGSSRTMLLNKALFDDEEFFNYRW